MALRLSNKIMKRATSIIRHRQLKGLGSELNEIEPIMQSHISHAQSEKGAGGR